MDKYLDLINKNILFILSKINNSNPIKEYFEYIMLPGGKKIRAALCLMTYEMYNDDLDEIINFASSIEFVHNYSLIHDDLPSMDDDDYRRGKLSLHKKYNEAVAILTGDALLNLFFEVTLEDALKNKDPEYKKIRAINELSKRTGYRGMVLGQVLDIKDELKTPEEIAFMYKKKTADLITASIVCAGIIAGTGEDEIHVLEKLGENLGLFFQIRDDIKDYDEDKAINKLTLIKDMSLDNSKELMMKYYNTCIDQLDILEKQYKRNVIGIKTLTDKLVEI